MITLAQSSLPQPAGGIVLGVIIVVVLLLVFSRGSKK